MTTHLVFRLQGPMAAFGDIAPGEVRTTWEQPSKSMVLGMVAAALGIDRDDQEGHAALHQGLLFATRVDRPGLTLRDYHTVQTGVSAKGFAPQTRREELRSKRLNTVVSTRWYRTDFSALVGLTRISETTPLLADIAAALARPRYVLFLGRKSCPVSEPLGAQLVEADSMVGAMATHSPGEHNAPTITVWGDTALGTRDHGGTSRVRRDARRVGQWPRTFADRTEVEL